MDARSTLRELLCVGAGKALAIYAPGARDLTFDDLRTQIAEAVLALNSIGIGAGDRVAIVLPNGPEMAAIFLAVASTAASAPLNPSYRGDEFEFYLTDLKAKAVIVEYSSTSPVIQIAKKLGIPILRVLPHPEWGAGRYSLDTSEMPKSSAILQTSAGAEDIALLLHTSGTTSRPKLVPLSQRNICSSARNIQKSLALTESDRGLNVMPLFHIHGLVAGLLAPLSAGGSVYCTPGFNALKFFSWMNAARPSWYTAVPTMHQAVLMRARQSAAVIADNRLRFIRSSSSSLPPQVLAEMERVFGCPVVEAYGMTEAAHQMTSNPLPPETRKPGTVGLDAGPAIAIMGEDGCLAAVGVTGEIVIRGDNVMAGYEGNPCANAEAFTNGWFRTGDQGVLDSEGYLIITGRLKEIINRGGDKIAPREIDEVLMDHPAVQQVVTFGIPHERLGEEVAAVVVLREGMMAGERELLDFVATRVADFKVPRQLIFMDEIPKGATGKLQRIGLAQKLGLY